MSEADVYFDGEVAALSDQRSLAKAEALAVQREVQRERERRRIRRRHMIDVEDDEDEICLLDIDADKLQAALDEIGTGGSSLSIDEVSLRSARDYYLAGRKAEAADAIYPAVRDALGVAV